MLKLPNAITERYVSNNSLRETRSQSVRMEGISSNMNSDQTDSYFRIGSKKVSDDSKNNDRSNSLSKDKEEAKAQPVVADAANIGKHVAICSNNLRAANAAQNKRANYSRSITKTLNDWLESHIHFPYPTEDQRVGLCRTTGLSRKQLRIWFINSRKVSAAYFA